MGIPGMQRFGINENLLKKVYIIKEIEHYKENNGKNAFIDIDLNGFIYSKCDGIEGALGGKHLRLIQKFLEFFHGLKAAGADLTFFSYGSMQIDKAKWWCQKQDDRYNQYYGMLSSNIVANNNISTKQFKCTFLVQSVIQMIKDENLGEVYITSGVECDRAMAKHAVDNEALAIVSGDTDFLFFEGPFQLWYHGITLNLSESSMDHFNREKLRSILQLNWDQMKIFATIAGNDITKPHLAYGREGLMKIAQICQNLNIDSTNEILSHMQFKNETNKRDIVLKSIQFYNIRRMEDLEKNNDFNSLVHSFKHENFFSYDVSFFNFGSRNQLLLPSTRRLLIHRVMEVFRKLGGLLSQDDREKTLKILTKCSHDDTYRQYNLQPKFEMSTDDKHRNKLLWCLGLDDDIIHDLGDILNHKRSLLLPMLSILFLKKVGEINNKQATAMLIVHYRVRSVVTNSISEVNSKTIRTAQIFLKICSLVRDCFYVCDLKELLVKVFKEKTQNIPALNDYYLKGGSILAHDGLYFANLMQKVEFRENSLNEDFNRRQVNQTLKKHLLESEDCFVEAFCRLLTK